MKIKEKIHINKKEEPIIIKRKDREDLLNIKSKDFDKYVSQLINLANQISQATRPNNIGNISEMFKEFKRKNKNGKLDDWEKYYRSKQKDSIEVATKKISNYINKLSESLNSINETVVKDWVEDLIFEKTYSGLNIQEIIIKKIAQMNNATYRLSNRKEEAKGIDGYINEKPVSIKPTSYDIKHLQEDIDVKIIRYKKKNNKLIIYYNDLNKNSDISLFLFYHTFHFILKLIPILLCQVLF